jgi:UDP-N-acetylglucosamine 2-epimerase (non-hydrolysing)
MPKLKVAIIFGTRPEAIKMAPVIKEIQKYPQEFHPVICVTGQHRKMLDQVLSIFRIKPDIDLNLMEENQSLDSLTANAIRKLTEALTKTSPGLVLVQGDTTTAMAAALAAFYQRIPVGHVEAGLRTHDRYNPFPEEINRNLISVLSSYHFAPTKKAVAALLREGINKNNIFLTGNTVVDALQMITKGRATAHFRGLRKKKIILITAHRRENFGQPFENICNALKEIAARNPDIEIVYPVHMNPNVAGPAHKILNHRDRIKLVQPLEYLDLVELMKKSYLVLTDSGGIQEEAPVFGKPVLVLREETERPEGIEAKVAKLVGTDKTRIIRETELLLHNRKAYLKMANAVSPYGDGKAAKRIVKIIREGFLKK